MTIPDFTQGFDEGVYSQMSTPSQSLGFPEILDFKAASYLLGKTQQNAPLLGVDGTMAPLTVNLDTESPHVLVVAGTGGGKSTVTRSILAQSVARGAVGVILDIKRCSHRWAYGSAQIGYAKTMPEIGNALVELGREVHRRNEVIEQWPGAIEDAPVGPRIVVAFEELNATMTQLRELDKRVPKGAYKAFEALNDVLLLGRAAKVHMIGVMQFPDFRILPQAMVEQFCTRIMIRYTKNAWVKIAWDAGMPQAAPSQAGRGMIVYGGKAREAQFLFLTEDECQALTNDRRAITGSHRGISA